MKIIKMGTVQKMTTFSSSTIYRLIKKGLFPKQIKLSEKSSGWIEQEVLDYLCDRANERSETC